MKVDITTAKGARLSVQVARRDVPGFMELLEKAVESYERAEQTKLDLARLKAKRAR